MGLRGLPWQCPIAQLLGIFLMALVRALIRRMLGRIPLSCRVFPKYELDFLATRIVFDDLFPRPGEKPNELSLLSTACLPTILAQHLFTSFMWEVAEKLDRDCLLSGDDGDLADAVKVDPRTSTLDALKETWYCPKLTHPRLESFVKH
ncbi:hypothetical protein MFIFM68171_09756 [Madurella fahalii]|uniref:Uncharacterized protein n=1 Tax=Madurella fahalii TaxID=1157608 RepID=A0ABQ0GP80_9PEZI